MANEIDTTKSYCITINYDAASDCGQVAGKHLSGGQPTIMSGKKVVLFRRAFNGKDVALTYENRPDLAELVNQFNAVNVERQTALNAAKAARQAEQDAVERPLIEAMEQEAARLRSLIPSDHIEVTVTQVGTFDGYPNLEYAVGEIWLNFGDVTVHGWASATRPGAMNSFKDICVASISQTKLAEIKANRHAAALQKVEAEEQTAKELAQKYETAKTSGIPVEIKRITDDCNDPSEECSTDIVTVYAMPNGSTQTERQHTW